MPTEIECSNQATATKKTYAKAMIVVKLGWLIKTGESPPLSEVL